MSFLSESTAATSPQLVWRYGGEAAGGGKGDGGGGLGDGDDGGEGGCVDDALRTHCIARGRCGRGTQLNRSPRRPREARCVWVFTLLLKMSVYVSHLNGLKRKCSSPFCSKISMVLFDI